MFPKRREKGLLTQELPNETIVYDKSNHKVHCLNAVSSFVWRRCDGRTSEAELAELLPGELGLPADEAHRRLTAIHGIGPWTADIYLLFCLGHADAWPAGDRY